MRYMIGNAVGSSRSDRIIRFPAAERWRIQLTRGRRARLIGKFDVQSVDQPPMPSFRAGSPHVPPVRDWGPACEFSTGKSLQSYSLGGEGSACAFG